MWNYLFGHQYSNNKNDISAAMNNDDMDNDNAISAAMDNDNDNHDLPEHLPFVDIESENLKSYDRDDSSVSQPSGGFGKLQESKAESEEDPIFADDDDSRLPSSSSTSSSSDSNQPFGNPMPEYPNATKAMAELAVNWGEGQAKRDNEAQEQAAAEEARYREKFLKQREDASNLARAKWEAMKKESMEAEAAKTATRSNLSNKRRAELDEEEHEAQVKKQREDRDNRASTRTSAQSRSARGMPTLSMSIPAYNESMFDILPPRGSGGSLDTWYYSDDPDYPVVGFGGADKIQLAAEGGGDEVDEEHREEEYAWDDDSLEAEVTEIHFMMAGDDGKTPEELEKEAKAEAYIKERTGKTNAEVAFEVETMSEASKIRRMRRFWDDTRVSSPRLLNGIYQPIVGRDYELHPIANKTISKFVRDPVPINHGTLEEDKVDLDPLLAKQQYAEQIVIWFMKQECPHFRGKTWAEVVDMANPYLLYLWQQELHENIRKDVRLTGKGGADISTHYWTMQRGGTAYTLGKFGYGFTLPEAYALSTLREMKEIDPMVHYCFVCVLGDHCLTCHQQGTNGTLEEVLNTTVYEFGNSLVRKLRSRGTFSETEILRRQGLEDPSDPDHLGPATKRHKICAGVDFKFLRLFCLLHNTLGSIKHKKETWYKNRFYTTAKEKQELYGCPLSENLIAQTGHFYQNTVVWLCNRGDCRLCSHGKYKRESGWLSDGTDGD